MGTDTGQTKAHFSIPSILAIAAAIGSFFVGAVGGLILAVIGIVFGIIGAIVALLPQVRGGLVSMLSLMLAAIGIAVAIGKAVAWAL